MATVIKGADELRRNLKRLSEVAFEAVRWPLADMAEDIIAASDTAAPTGTGALKASHFVSSPFANQARQSVTVAAGYEAEHAPYVHEGVHGHFHVTPPKFLERAAAGQESKLAETVGDALRQALGL